MIKIRSIQFKKHPILGSLKLDFCDRNGDAVDTVIIAGENGCGKSTILNELYKISTNAVDNEVIIELEIDGKVNTIDYHYEEISTDNYAMFAGKDLMVGSQYRSKIPFAGIFSDVEINFTANEINTVSSMKLDSSKDSRRSTTNLPTQVKQLLVDIQAMDDASLAEAFRNASGDIKVGELSYEERMPRFTKAFNRMFDNLSYSRIENENNHKVVSFEKFGRKVSIDNLSSGEKQVVYRGCFLLKDVSATKGALVFIDEPEISLHPNWQKKVLDYYKDIFKDENGNQTSQIFVVTHSPFIIHNESRYNDKVLVLSRGTNGEIVVSDKPSYYQFKDIEVVQDAFSLEGILDSDKVVLLEGRTDEKYFNAALEVFNYNVDYKFKWVGHIAGNGQEENTGKDALNRAVLLLKNGVFRNNKIICLFDNDVNRKEENDKYVSVKVMPQFDNSKKIKRGIENALKLEKLDISKFYRTKESTGEYGEKKNIQELDKMSLCNYICELPREELMPIFMNLRQTIEELNAMFNI